jgi:hypothetical protein
VTTQALQLGIRYTLQNNNNNKNGIDDEACGIVLYDRRTCHATACCLKPDAPWKWWRGGKILKEMVLGVTKLSQMIKLQA